MFFDMHHPVHRQLGQPESVPDDSFDGLRSDLPVTNTNAVQEGRLGPFGPRRGGGRPPTTVRLIIGA